MQDSSRTALQKYQDTVIGNRRFISLLRYEIITLLFGELPGVAGLGLRRLTYPSLFGAVGKNPVFGNHISLRGARRIYMGDDVMLDDHAFLSVRCQAEQALHIGNNVIVGRYCQLKVRGGKMHLGSDISIGPYSYLGTTTTLTVGDHCLVGTNSFIGGIQHSFSDPDTPIQEQELSDRGGVHLGKDVWIGAHVVINDGVTIGDGAVVGANAVVTKDVPPFTIVAGVPATVIGQRQ